MTLRDQTRERRALWARSGEDSLTGLFLRTLRSGALEGTGWSWPPASGWRPWRMGRIPAYEDFEDARHLRQAPERGAGAGEGLNVIEAPNEGGKSTWSAFLRAMLYGINTKERDRQGYLAEKNRYQPWSGAAMEGSVELLWQGRSVTLRRGPRGAPPLAALRRCIPARRSWCPASPGTTRGDPHRRAPGGIRALRLRGPGGAAIDGAPPWRPASPPWPPAGREDVSYSQVERRLRDWLNRRKHNKTGLIPRLEEELADVEETLARQSKAFRLAQEARRELERLQAEHRLLESERDAHLSRAMAQRRARWEAAQAALPRPRPRWTAWRPSVPATARLPDRDTLKRAQEELNALNTLPRQPQAGGEPAGGGPGGGGGGPGLRRGSPVPRPDPRRGLGAGRRRRGRRRAAGPKQRGCTRAASCCWQWARWGS